jgi:prepilin-type N-terminal cleavage/methylation domain-containing protein
MKNKIFHNINITSSGFTLLEMLFALVIFSFALVSLMTIAGRGVITTTNAKEQLLVQYLAEELVEVARNERDTAFIAGNFENAVTDLLVKCGARGGCDIVYTETNEMPELSRSFDCQPLYYNQETGIFDTNPENVASGGLSPYCRTLSIRELDSNQIELNATVRWNQRGVDRSYTLTTHLVNWAQPYQSE